MQRGGTMTVAFLFLEGERGRKGKSDILKRKSSCSGQQANMASPKRRCSRRSSTARKRSQKRYRTHRFRIYREGQKGETGDTERATLSIMGYTDIVRGDQYVHKIDKFPFKYQISGDEVALVGLGPEEDGVTLKPPLHFPPGETRRNGNIVFQGEVGLSIPSYEHTAIATLEIPYLRDGIYSQAPNETLNRIDDEKRKKTFFLQ